MSKVIRSEPHFIRCIRPNIQNLPDIIDANMVLHQLQSTGVLETIKIRQKVLFDNFLKNLISVRWSLTVYQIPAFRKGTDVSICYFLWHIFLIYLLNIILKRFQREPSIDKTASGNCFNLIFLSFLFIGIFRTYSIR